MPTSAVDSVVDPHENRKDAIISVGLLSDLKWRAIVERKVRSPHPFGGVFPIALKSINRLRETSRHVKILKW